MSEKTAEAGKNPSVTARKEKRMKWWKEHKHNSEAKKKKEETSAEGGKREGLRQSTLDVKPSTYTESRLIQQELQNKSGFRSKIQVKVTNKKTVPSKKNQSENQKVNHVKDIKNSQKVSPSSKKSSTEESGVDNSDSPSKHLPKNYVLFIGNLPYNITKEKLEEHFRKTGGVKRIRIPKEKGSEKTRGFAYIEFKDRISHNIALRLHHTTLAGRKINVEFTSIGGGKSEQRKEKLKMKNLSRAKMKMPFEKS